MQKVGRLVFLALATLAAGCDSGSGSGRGFTLPEGDVNKGETVFLKLNCNGCHKITGNSEIQQPDEAPLSIPLGGSVTRIKTYGELVTSVINPSHTLASGIPARAITADMKSKMPVYNEVMTVEQLIDLVAFLQQQYQLDTYTRTRYRNY